jgi:hypothetical protein
MAVTRIGSGVFAMATVLTVTGVAPASAEFFGCNEPHTKVTYSSRPLYSPAPRAQYTTHYTHEFAAQRSRHTTYAQPRTNRRSYERW